MEQELNKFSKLQCQTLVHSEKSHTNQLGFSYSKALRIVNLFESGCLLFEP